MNIERKNRDFLPNDLTINTWEDLQPFFEDLDKRCIQSKNDLERFLKDVSELEAVLEEDVAWRYIKMTIDTRDQELSKRYTDFMSNIQPQISPYDDKFNRKINDSEFKNDFVGSDFKIYFRGIQNSIELFRESNIQLLSELANDSQEYGAITGDQSIELDGEKLTMQKASIKLKDPDRSLRKKVFELIAKRRLEDTDKLESLFDKLLSKRNQVAKNAGFDNYRDYKFKDLGRFDYSIQDCFDFHESVRSEIVPIVKELQQKKYALMNLDAIKPYDTDVDPLGRAPLKPFEGGEELLKKSVEIFAKIDPYFGDCLQTMDNMGHLDLDSKDGKAPGGYNYPLYEIGVPFIFMNSVGAQRDLVTMMHEGGHAVHSFLSRDLNLTGFKSLPSEVAELASMSMELLSMDYWDVFYSDKEDLKRAKIEQLETLLSILPWVATVDKFQHWLYTNPTNNKNARSEKWIEINKEFGTGLVDWSGYEDYRKHSWHRQLHIFEVPFYYIEYGISQLGAIAVWKNYKEDPSKAVQQYKEALALGYTKSIPEIYDTAGIQFDFSKKYISELADFVKSELKKLD
ncbi:MAG: M3 family oligoendopeptidase [Crocinitomicaceae bacterium]|nr:M3 family oligoendopeptidase [Crocinitomicaceae bacterium]